MLPKSYPLSDRVILTTTRQRYYDVHYSQVYINIHEAKAGEVFLDVPIGPPLARVFQIFQIRLTSSSPSCEWSIHTRPYAECTNQADWVFKCVTDGLDEMLQETWLVSRANLCTSPYLFFSFKGLSGVDPENARLELRVTG